MNNTLLALVAAAAMATTGAVAQTLPAGFYMGLGTELVQSTAKHANSQAAAGVNLGMDLNQHLAAELDLRNAFANGNRKQTQTVMADAKVGVPVNLGFATVKPYALVGTGYGFSSKSKTNNSTTVQPIYNLGAGLVVPVAAHVDVDLRYTHSATYNTPSRDSDVLGMNVHYRF
jgi:hypothetical protein